MTVAALAALIAGAGAAAANPSDVLADTQVAAAPFGLLGPVGLGAVALGIIGMVIGTARRRRVLARSVEARMAADAHRAAAARAAAGSERRRAEVPAPSQPPLVEQPTEPLDSVRTGRAA